MTDIRQLIAQEFSLPSSNINNALNLWLEGATVPFIARNSKSEYKLSQ
ncbi:MAG: hypothetical protein AAF383_03255 [Cyanobacteria bacterium P01_A01_bin.83]